jgi:hypothetical protein
LIIRNRLIYKLLIFGLGFGQRFAGPGDLKLFHSFAVIDNAISFFTEIGLKREGRAMVESEWSGRITELKNQSVEIAMMVTPDGHSRLELSRFITPTTIF